MFLYIAMQTYKELIIGKFPYSFTSISGVVATTLAFQGGRPGF
jgi:hypothetical protein